MKKITLSMLLLLCSSLLVLSCSDDKKKDDSVHLELAGSTYVDKEDTLIFDENNKARIIVSTPNGEKVFSVQVLNIKKVNDGYELKVDIIPLEESINLTESSITKATFKMSLDQNEVVIVINDDQSSVLKKVGNDYTIPSSVNPSDDDDNDNDDDNDDDNDKNSYNSSTTHYNVTVTSSELNLVGSTYIDENEENEIKFDENDIIGFINQDSGIMLTLKILNISKIDTGYELSTIWATEYDSVESYEMIEPDVIMQISEDKNQLKQLIKNGKESRIYTKVNTSNNTTSVADDEDENFDDYDETSTSSELDLHSAYSASEQGDMYAVLTFSPNKTAFLVIKDKNIYSSNRLCEVSLDISEIKKVEDGYELKAKISESRINKMSNMTTVTIKISQDQNIATIFDSTGRERLTLKKMEIVKLQ